MIFHSYVSLPEGISPLNHHHKADPPRCQSPVQSYAAQVASQHSSALAPAVAYAARKPFPENTRKPPLETNPEWMQSVKKSRKFIVDSENHANLWLKLMDVDSDVNIDGSRRLGDLQPSITPATLGCGRTFSKMLDQTSPTGHRHL